MLQRSLRWLLVPACVVLAAAAAQAAPIPVATLDVPAGTMVGEQMRFTVSFDNTSAADTGYGPFIDLVFPVNGADGAAGTDTPDGLDFVDATYLGASLEKFVLSFPDDGGGMGCVDHPLLVDTNHVPLQVCGTAGDRLVVLRLPFGSVVPDQPAITVDVTADLSDLADLGVPLTVHARGGFEFGADPLDNPCCDPVIANPADTDSDAWPAASTTPQLMSISKVFVSPDTLGLEDEITVGPAYPRRFRVVVDIADGQTITNLDLRDNLPGNMQFVSVVQTLVHGNPVGTTAISTPDTSTPGGILTRRFASVTGQAGQDDAVMEFAFYIPRVDAGGNPVIPPGSCATATSPNDASALGDWSPLDPRDTGGTGNASADPPGPEASLSIKTIPLQKAATIVNDTGAPGPSPGDTVEYTLEFQVSDVMAFGGLMLQDVTSDGQRFDTGFTPTLEIHEHGTTTGPAAFDPANFSVIDHYTGAPAPQPPIDGTQELSFDVSAEMVQRGLDADLLGSCVPDGGTGGGPADCAAYAAGETKAIVVFRTVIQDNFSDDYPSGDPSVDQGDVLTDAVTVSGALLDPADLSPAGPTCSDGSSASLTIVRGALTKSLYAINGSTTLPSPLEIFPGDTVTYRIRYTLPTSDVEDLYFVDYLPLPVFDATEVASFSATADATPPPAGTAKFGPDDTFYALSGIAPALVSDGGANTVRFTYGDFDDPGNSSTVVDILFTVTVTDEPFADGLYLTNQVRAHEGTTNAGTETSDAIVQIELREPFLAVRKGACSTDNPDAQYAPPLSGGACPGPVSSNDLDGDPALSDSNVSGLDVGDHMSFSMTIENQGGSGAFDITIHDVMPPGFCLPGCTTADPTCAAGASGLNLAVTRGDGFVPTWTPQGSYGDDRDLFSGGLMLDDSAGQPLCQPHDPAAGTNTLTISYELEICDPTLVPETLLANQGGVTNYAGTEGGPSHVDPTNPADFTDEAGVTLASPQLLKTLVGTEIADATNGAGEAVIGEYATYQLVLTVPETTMPATTITDTLDRGLAFVDVLSVTMSPDITSSNTVGTGANPSNVNVSSGGRVITFDFGDVVNSNRDNSVDETITIVYRAVVLDQARNQAGRRRNNSATAVWTGGSVGPVSAPNLRIIEPAILIDKNASPTAADAGDTITYTINVSSPTGGNQADAQDVVVTDAIPAGLSYVAGSLATGTCATAPTTVDDSAAPTLAVGWTTFPPGGSCQITYQAVVDPTVNPDQQLPNTAHVVWSSLPGSPGQRSVHNSDSTERDGSGGVNDYFADDTATVTITSPQMAKVVFDTSESFTGSSEHDPNLADLAIGETVTYRITTTLPEGTTPQVILTDNLPANATGVLEVVSATPISIGANLTVTNDPPNITIADNNLGDGLDDTVSFDYGQTVNTPDGVQNADDQIVVEVVARVVNVAANADGHVLTNTALLQYGSGLQASATVDVEIVEPVLAVDKSVSPSTGDAGDTVTFTLNVHHAGSSAAEAFDLVLNDVIPSDLSYVAGSLDCTGGSAVPAVCTEGGGTISASWDALLQGDDTVITFQATLDTSVQPEQVITNTANLGWDTLPADSDPNERSYSASDAAQVTVTAPGVTKVVTATSVAATGSSVNGPEPDLTIGEQVTFEITVTVPEGTTPGATLVDDLPVAPGVLELVSSQITAMDADMSSSNGLGVGSTGTPSDRNGDGRDDRASFDFGTLVNGVGGSNTITFEVVAVVPDIPANHGGLDDLVNTATASSSGGTPVLATAAVDLVEPRLGVTKEVVDPASPFGDAGDTITYRITVEHLAASTADANDVTLSDILPAGEVYQSGSLNVIDGPAPVEDTSGLPGSVSFSWPGITLADSPVILEYQVVLDGSVQPALSYTNTAQLSWDSLPGGVPGDGGPNDRTGTAGDTADITINAPSLVKITGVTSLSDTGSSQHNPSWEDLAIGEQVTYELTVTVPEGTTANAVVTDAVQADANGVLEAIGASVVSIGAHITTSNPGTPVLADNSLGDGLADTVTFDFGTITNTADNVIDDSDRIVLEVTARVVNVPANGDGNALINFGTLSYATGQPVDDDASVDVVEPAMGIAKSMSGPVDGVVTLSVALSNTGTAPAYDLVVADAMPAAMWDTSSITPMSIPAGFTFAVTGAPGDATVTIASDPGSSPPDSSVEPGETVVFTFTAALPGGANPPVSPVTNTAGNNQATTLPGNDPAERQEPPVQGAASLDLPNIELDKSWAIAPGGDLDGSGTPSPGDILRYTITVRNGGTGTATNLVVTDPLNDPNLSLATGTVNAGGGGVVFSGNNGGDTTVGVRFASFAGDGNSAVITYDVQVANPVAAGVSTLTNWASADSDQLPPEPSNDPGTPDDDDPTVVPLDAVPDIAVTKDDGVGEARPGDTLSYTITVSNVGNQNATGVVLTDAIPAGTAFVSASNGGTLAGGTVSWPAFDLAAGASVQRTLTIRVDDPAPAGQASVDNTAHAVDDGSNGQDPNPANNDGTDTDTLIQADLGVTKTDSPDPVRAGEQLTYTISVVNNGPSSEPNAVVSDTLPAAFSFSSAVPSQGSCTEAGGVVSCNLGAIANGGGATITLVCDVPSGTAAGTYTNTVAVSGDESDPVAANDTDSEDTEVVEEADLALVKTDSPDPVTAGEELTWTLEVSNNGPSDATNLVVTDTLPAEVGFVSADAECSEAGGTVTCNLASLADGDSHSFTIVVSVDPSATGTITNTASVTADQTDPDSGNNSDGEDTTIATMADLSVVKDGPATVSRGSDLSYTITVSNAGPSDAAAVVLSDPTPGGLGFLSATAPCSGGFPCSLGDLAAGDSLNLTLTFNVPAGYSGADPIVNTASVASDTPDADPTDNSDDATTAVDRTPECDLAITKTGPPSAAVGSTVSYTLVVTNAGPDGAENTVLSDPTPAGLSFVSATAPCAGGFPCSLGTLDPADTVTVHVTFQVPAGYTDTQILNTATVTTDTAETDTGNNSDDATTPIGAETTDLAVDKQGPVAANPGDDITYTITVSNLGPGDATGVTATDAFPADVTWLSDTCGNDFADGVWNIGALAAGDSISCRITAHVDPSAAGPRTNSVVVSGNETESDTSNNDDAVVTGLGAPAADVAVVKTGPARTFPGSDPVFTLTVTNNGPGSALNVVLDDTTPAGLSFVSASAPCTGGFPCALGDMAAGSSLTVNLSFHVPTDYSGADPIVNTATVATDSQDTNPANDTDDATVDFVPEADLSITKDDGVDTVVPGMPLTYTIVVHNAGPGDVSGGTVTDVFPAALLAPAWSCTASAGALCGSGSGNIADTVNMPVGATLTYTVTATVAADATGTLSNTATVTLPAGMTDPTPDDNSDTDVDTLAPTSDLGIAKTDSPDPVVAGGQLVYTLSVVNNGPSTATGVTVTDTLPAALHFQSATASQGSCAESGGTVTCALGTMTPAGTATIVITTLVDGGTPPGTLQNTASVSGDGTDPVPDNDTATEPTGVLSQVDLSIVKTDSPDPVHEGGQLTYTLHVANAGPSDATGVTVVDSLPPALSFVSASPGCSELAGTVTCNVGALAAGASRDLQIVATVPYGEPGPLENTAVISGDQTDTEPANDADDESTEVLYTRLSAVKTASAPANGEAFAEGETITWTITVSNAGNLDADPAALTDPLPPGVSYIPGSMTLDGVPLTDAADGDAGSYDPGSRTITADLAAVWASGSRVLVFQTSARPKQIIGHTEVANQAVIHGPGDETIDSDDPDTTLDGDPTVIHLIAAAIPVLDGFGLVIFILMMLGAGWVAIRRL